MSYVDEKWRRAVGAARAALLLANGYNLGDLTAELGLYATNLGQAPRPGGMPQQDEMRAACDKLSVASAYYVLAKVGEEFGEEFPDMNQMEAVAAAGKD